jgi:CDP-diacylglycerol pyrophosphatase
MTSDENKHSWLRQLAGMTAAIVSTFALAFLSSLAVLGLPLKDEPPIRYADRVCRLAKATVDRHLPCLGDTANGSSKPNDRQALWSVIRTACVPASYFGLTLPCAKVNRDRGYAVIKSPAPYGLSFIVTPVVPVAGIESLATTTGDTNRLWLAAWEERDLLERAAKHKINWSDVVLAVNSKSTRSQDQLHIHLGCIKSSIRDFLAVEPSSTGENWQSAHPSSINVSFFVKLLPEEDIRRDLFKLVFDELPGGRLFAEKQTIALAGVTRGSWRGFALIVTLDAVSAEEFIARDC